MHEEIIIHSTVDGHSAKVNDMLSEFQSQNQDNSIYEPLIRFTDDCLYSKNAVSFLLKIKELNPVVEFSTIFPKDSLDPSILINSIINYLNEFPKLPNRFILKIGGTDEKKRKEIFAGKAHGLSDISKMFTKQPISTKNKPILEISSDVNLDAKHLANFFPVNKFAFKIADNVSGNRAIMEKDMIAAGYEKEPEVEEDFSLL